MTHPCDGLVLADGKEQTWRAGAALAGASESANGAAAEPADSVRKPEEEPDE
jgi:hypothetical protein